MKPRCVHRKHCRGCNLFNFASASFIKKQNNNKKNNTSKCRSPPPSRLSFIYLFTCCCFFYYFTLKILSSQPCFPTGYPAVKKFPILVSLPHCTSVWVSGCWGKEEEKLAVSCICVFIICVFSRYLRGEVTPPGCVSHTHASSLWPDVTQLVCSLDLKSANSTTQKRKGKREIETSAQIKLSPPLISPDIRFVKRTWGSLLWSGYCHVIIILFFYTSNSLTLCALFTNGLLMTDCAAEAVKFFRDK